MIPPIALLVAAQLVVLLLAVAVAALGGSPYPVAVAATFATISTQIRYAR